MQKLSLDKEFLLVQNRYQLNTLAPVQICVYLYYQNNTCFRLDNVETDADFKVKMCEWFSRACSYDLVYRKDYLNQKFYKENCEVFNAVCGTAFSVEDMQVVYQYLGNGVNHNKAYAFVIDGFNIADLINNK